MSGSTRSLRRRTKALFLLLAMAVSTSFAAYPGKPVKLVVPFAPGGGTGLIARSLGAGMSKELGQQVFIDSSARTSLRASWSSVCSN